MRRRFSTLLSLLCVTAALAACGDDRVTGPGPDPNPEPEPVAVALDGQLINRATREPVSGATISFGEATTTSASNGRFTFADLTPGTYTLRTSASGFEDLEQDVTVPAGGYVREFYLDRLVLFEVGDFTLYVPATASTVRGVLLALGGPDTRAFASGAPFGAPVPEVEAALQTLGEHFRKLASDNGLAILGTSHAAMANGAASDEILTAALAEVAAASGRPSVATAPVLVYGMGSGAPQAAGFAARHPERTIGVYLKVPMDVETLAGAAALAVPTFVALAEDDAFVDNAAITATFETNRRAGGLWALATERAVPHHSLTPRHRELTLHWMRDVLTLRLGPIPGSLLAIPESSSWLGDPATGEVAQQAYFRGDPLEASWLPGWETGERWDDLARAEGPTASTIRFSRPSMSVRAGWSDYISAGVRDATGAQVWDPSVVFTSDREDVARIEQHGCNWYCDAVVAQIFAESEGVASITASYGEYTAHSAITVLPAVRLEIDPAEATIPLGGYIDLTVRVVELSGAVVPEPEFSIYPHLCYYCWPSSYVTIGGATVDGDGTHFRVQGIARGIETIYFAPVGVTAPSSEVVITVE